MSGCCSAWMIDACLRSMFLDHHLLRPSGRRRLPDTHFGALPACRKNFSRAQGSTSDPPAIWFSGDHGRSREEGSPWQRQQRVLRKPAGPEFHPSRLAYLNDGGVDSPVSRWWRGLSDELPPVPTAAARPTDVPGPADDAEQPDPEHDAVTVLERDAFFAGLLATGAYLRTDRAESGQACCEVLHLPQRPVPRVRHLKFSRPLRRTSHSPPTERPRR